MMRHVKSTTTIWSLNDFVAPLSSGPIPRCPARLGRRRLEQHVQASPGIALFALCINRAPGLLEPYENGLIRGSTASH